MMAVHLGEGGPKAAMEEAAKRLRFLGTPLFRGLSDRPWPVVPWEGGMVRLGAVHLG